MSKFLWFIVGLIAGELWTGWLMHIVYIGIILFLLSGGKYWCAPPL